VKRWLLLLLVVACSTLQAQPAGQWSGSLQDGLPHGEGRMDWPDGRSYVGPMRAGKLHGEGRFRGARGELYEGTFTADTFTGQGTLNLPDGTRYRGDFVNWLAHGRGRLVDPAGMVYEGEFKNGLFDGQGTMRLPNGEVRTGTWRKGVAYNAAEELRAALAVETALYSQRALLDKALAGIAPQRPDRIDLYLLAIAGDGSQEVFRREVEFVREQFDRDFGTRGRSVALINSRSTAGSAPMATQTSLRESLRAIAAKMDREQDILFVFLTSHGSPEELKLHQDNIGLRGLSPADLAALLKETGARWKVVMVSACYSGVFLDPLRDERTLVITAARHDRQSFGCDDKSDFTWFGRAFFRESLGASRSFDEAFAKAQALVGEWEKRDKYEPSLPQIHSPRAVAEQLRRWWPQKP
jgi:hypothetical protein